MTEQGIPEKIGRISVRLDLVEKGVANFRDFQKDAREFFTKHETREEEREKTEKERAALRDSVDKRRAKIHFLLLSGVISLLITELGTVLAWIHQLSGGH